MVDARRCAKGTCAKWAVALLLLVQFFTFSGFSDVASCRDAGTQSEWIASFPDRWKKTVSFRRASRHAPAILPEAKTLFRRVLQHQNNRYLTWWAIACTACVDEPFIHLPVSVWPRSAPEENRS